MMDWKLWKGKKIFIRTNYEKVYTGVIQDAWEERPGVFMIHLLDKYNKNVVVLSNQILELKEEN